MRFSERVALVTGGATGIGAAVVRLLADEGARVAVVSNTPVAQTMVVCEEVRQAGGTAEPYQCDVANYQRVEEVVNAAIKTFGRIDVAVNCAGVFALNPVFEADTSVIDDLFAVNFKGTYNVMRAVLPHMRSNGGGVIVNTSSGAAILGQGTYSAYAASKAAVLHMTRTIAPELKGTRIRVNCVAPGATRTPMTAHVHSAASAEREASLQALNKMIPSAYGEPWLEPKDVAEVIAFLASDAARGVQSTCIVVDQGLSAAMPNL